jgi:hypothetical protein
MTMAHLSMSLSLMKLDINIVPSELEIDEL